MRRPLVLSVALSAIIVGQSPATAGPASLSTLRSCSSAAFGTPRYIPAASGGTTYAIDKADVNEDGIVDIVVANFWGLASVQLNIYLGDGHGGFTATAIELPVGTLSFMYMRAVDVTGDGHADLVSTGADLAGNGTVTVFAGDGTGAFALFSSATYGAGVFPDDVGYRDVDGDGHLDLVILSSRNDQTLTGTVHVLKGDGAGHFAAPIDTAVGTQPMGLALADFNGDGRLDIATSFYGVPGIVAGSVETRLGDGAGHFGAPISSYALIGPTRIAAGDFSEDGHADIAVSWQGTTTNGGVSVFPGDGSGQLGTPVSFSVTGDPLEIVAADLTGDGHLDLTVSGVYYAAQRFSSVLEVFPGAGDGMFGPATLFPVNGDGSVFYPVVDDFDRDGRPDIAAGGQGPQRGGRLAVLLSMCGNVADLAVSQNGGPDPVMITKPVTHTVQVVNHGPDPASAILTITVPAGLTFVSASATPGACFPASPSDIPNQWNRAVSCSLGDLAGTVPANTSTVTLTTTAAAAGTWTTRSVVSTSVVDPDQSSNVVQSDTHVDVPGARDLTISSAPTGGTSLTWSSGTSEAGYIVWRNAGGTTTRFPASGLLPADTTAFVDASPVAGQLNCYRVVAAAADETPINASSVLCLSPDSASPPGTLGDFRIHTVSATQAQMDWSPFSGFHTAYVLRVYVNGLVQSRSVAPYATTGQMPLFGFTCFVLIPLNGSTPLGNSTALCAQPGTP